MSEKLLDIITEDSCCARRLSRDLEKGKVSGDRWLCPGCGVEWRAELKVSDETPYRKWAPHCPVMIVRSADLSC